MVNRTKRCCSVFQTLFSQRNVTETSIDVLPSKNRPCVSTLGMITKEYIVINAYVLVLCDNRTNRDNRS